MIDMIASVICLAVSLAAAVVAGGAAATAAEKNSPAMVICVLTSGILGVVALALAYISHL